MSFDQKHTVEHKLCRFCLEEGKKERDTKMSETVEMWRRWACVWEAVCCNVKLALRHFHVLCFTVAKACLCCAFLSFFFLLRFLSLAHKRLNFSSQPYSQAACIWVCMAVCLCVCCNYISAYVGQRITTEFYLIKSLQPSFFLLLSGVLSLCPSPLRLSTHMVLKSPSNIPKSTRFNSQ